jgi:hypothetical protein
MQMSVLFLDQNMYTLSNGALCFPVSLTLCTGKWIQLFTETVFAFNLHFQHIGLNLHVTENKVYHHWKEYKILVKK